MNPFRNSDEPYPPDWFMHSAIPWPEWMRFIGWYARNPFHDVFNYRWSRPVTRPIYLAGKSDPFADELKKPFVLRFRPFFFMWPIPFPVRFVGWRSDKPLENWFGKNLGPGGGGFDIGWKQLG